MASLAFTAQPGGGEGKKADDVRSRTPPHLTLWCNRTCPYAQRVLLWLSECGYLRGTQPPCELRTVDVIGDKDETFVRLFRGVCPDAARRPAIPLLEHRAVPVYSEAGDGDARDITDGGDCGGAGEGSTTAASVVVVESTIILLYFDDICAAAAAAACSSTNVTADSPLPPYRPLLPRRPVDRAVARLFVDIFNKALAPCLARILNATTADALYQARESLVAGLVTVDGFLVAHASHTSGGGCFVVRGSGEDKGGDKDRDGDGDWDGDGFGFAECVTAPDLQRLVVLAPLLRGDTVDTIVIMGKRKLSRLEAWVEAVMARESVHESFHRDEVVELKSRFVPKMRYDLSQGEGQGDDF